MATLALITGKVGSGGTTGVAAMLVSDGMIVTVGSGGTTVGAGTVASGGTTVVAGTVGSGGRTGVAGTVASGATTAGHAESATTRTPARLSARQPGRQNRHSILRSRPKCWTGRHEATCER